MNKEANYLEGGDHSLANQYHDWCIENHDPHRKTCGRYGPEFRIRVDAPIDKIADLVREAGCEPTLERLDMLLQEMESNRFEDKHGGCPPDEVLGRIIDQAAESIDILVENGEFEE